MTDRKTVWIDEWCGNRFDNREDALASAQKNAHRNSMDVAIWRQDPVAIVRFPSPSYPVEELVVTQATAT